MDDLHGGANANVLNWIFHISWGAVSDTSKIVILKLLASEYENVFSGAW